MSEIKLSPTPAQIEEFVTGYVVCALWSSTECDEQGNNCTPLDDNYDASDIAESSMAGHREECTDYIAANIDLLRQVTDSPHGYTWGRAGHDLWLTRNGHGAGFWDRGLGEAGEKLSEAARLCGGADPYVGDDGKVYLS